MFCDIRLKLRRVRACLTIVLASTATLGMPNQALAAYDFSKLGAAIETLSPETVSDWEKKARAGDAMAQNIMGLVFTFTVILTICHLTLKKRIARY